MKHSDVRVRYAPSPTGLFHVGGARTALFNYLFAKKHGGTFIVRVEDTDQARHTEQGIASQFDGLRWLGLQWDESIDTPHATKGPYRQTERLHVYAAAIDRCLAEGHAYRCYCTEEELQQEKERQEAQGLTPRYNGPCRDATEDQRQQWEREGRTAVIRWRVPHDRTYTVHDHVRGTVTWPSADIGDWVIARADGMPTYNFAVVVDDIAMGISHVIRGEEHLSNTPRQCMVYEALGAPLPQFAHLPLILNEQRKKMSKRDGSIVQFIEQYRQLGYMPESLVNFMALLGWSPPNEQELFSLDELIEAFDLERIHKNGAVFDTAKLHWMNNAYLRKQPLPEVVACVAPCVDAYVTIGAVASGDTLPVVRTNAWMQECVALYLEPMRYGAELQEWLPPLLPGEIVKNAETQAVLEEPTARSVLQAFYEAFVALEDATEWTAQTVATLLAQAQHHSGQKGKKLFMPIRVALTGATHGRDLTRTIALLERPMVLERLRTALEEL